MKIYEQTKKLIAFAKSLLHMRLSVVVFHLEKKNVSTKLQIVQCDSFHSHFHYELICCGPLFFSILLTFNSCSFPSSLSHSLFKLITREKTNRIKSKLKITPSRINTWHFSLQYVLAKLKHTTMNDGNDNDYSHTEWNELVSYQNSATTWQFQHQLSEKWKEKKIEKKEKEKRRKKKIYIYK